MRRHLLDLVVTLGTASAVTGYLVVAEPQWRSIVLRIYIFIAGALAMFILVSLAGDAVPRRRKSQFELALTQDTRQPPRVADFDRVAREVVMATTSAFDLHIRVLPALREIADARLERIGRRASPDTLGRWWDLLRPDREPPAERFGNGIALGELRACIDDLEKIR